jgi:hypothetical protein
MVTEEEEIEIPSSEEISDAVSDPNTTDSIISKHKKPLTKKEKDRKKRNREKLTKKLRKKIKERKRKQDFDK